MIRVLLVEDDQKLSEALVHILKEKQYEVDAVMNGVEGLYYASNYDYDALILDVMLPGMDGYEVITNLRKQKVTTPTLMLTAKSDIVDKVRGLDSGADDYLVKPFATEELMARLRALTRRSGDVVINEITVGNLTLNLDLLTLKCGVKSVNLSNKEYQMLKVLMQNQGNILSKEQLINKVWGNNSEATDNNVEAYISFLRKKLTYLDTKMGIKSIRMVGYRLENTQ